MGKKKAKTLLWESDYDSDPDTNFLQLHFGNILILWILFRV